VKDIVKENGHFIIKSNLDDIECDKVIIACGSKSSPKTGTDGSIFQILDRYHTVNKVLPSLVPLKVNGNFLKDWNNLRVDGKLSLYVDNELIKEEIGEIQLTDYGISGIPTFNISGKAVKALDEDKKVEVKINFLPEDNISYLLDTRSNNLPNHTIEELLESILPYQLIFTLLKISNINRSDNWNKLSQDKKKTLINNISNLSLEITDTLDFDRSQVSTGGVSLTEINPSTLESLKVPGMYLVGEVLDVDGICGGFNLAFAFTTGYLAGIGVSND
jgi:predicted Rossmann fold flavoprotein